MGRDDDSDDKKEDEDERELLARVQAELESRLRQTVADFVADLPALIRRERAGTPSRPRRSPGEEFASLLLSWVAEAPARGMRGYRYLLIWYVKHVSDRGAREVPDAAALAAMIRTHLSGWEIDRIDEAIADGWPLDSGTIRTLACKRWKQFRAALSSEDRERFAPYLAAFAPPGAVVAVPPRQPSQPMVPRPPRWLATPAGAVTVVAALPVLAIIAWVAARGRTPDPPHAARAEHRAEAGQPAASLTSSRPVLPPADDAGAPTPDAAPRTIPDDGVSRFRWVRPYAGDGRPLNGATWSGDLAVVVGRDGALLTSPDGEAWGEVTLPASFYHGAIAYGAGRFVAVGSSAYGSQNGRIITTSTDGVAWSTERWAERPALGAICYGDGVFVAVGTMGSVVRSTDGVTWTSVVSGTGHHLQVVAYIDGQFVALGQQGVILTSVDGAAWRTTSAGLDVSFSGLVHDDTYLASTHTRTIMRSADLRHWTPYQLDHPERIQALIAIDDVLYATAPGQGIIRSLDGVAWTIEVPPSEFGQGAALAWTGTVLIAVGFDGTIITGRLRT